MSRSSRRVVFVRRWSFFVSAIWLSIFSGPYGFANYSTALKEVLGLNQRQLNRLSVAKDLGDSCGVLAGILSNYLPAWGQLWIGATIGLVGYGVQWLVVSEIISPLPFWVMWIASLVGGNSMAWINTAAFTTSVRNFPRNRGPVVGLFKAYMGVSAAIFAKICDLVFASSSSKYLLLQTFLPSIFCIITGFFMQSVPPAETEEDDLEEKRSLFYFNLIACCLAIYLGVLNIFTIESESLKTLAVVLLFIIAAGVPIFVPVFLYMRTRSSSSFYGLDLGLKEQIDVEEIEEKKLIQNNPCNNLDEKESILREALLNTPRVEQTSVSKSRMQGSRCCNLEPVPELGDERHTLTLFRSWDFYVLYVALLCGPGVGMAFSNNLGQIGQSLGYTDATVSTCFFSLGNFVGRMGAGLVSEHLIRIAALPRPAWIGAAKLPMIATFLWLATGTGASMYTTSVVVGICHGSLITLTIPIVSEFYGLKQFGLNFMVTSTHLLAGSILFSGVVAGYLYDLEAERQQGRSSNSWWRWLASSDGTLTCYGSKCFGLTLVIIAASMGASLIFDIVLVYVTRPLYRKIQWINCRLANPSHENLS